MRIFEVEGDSVEDIISQFTKQQNVPADYISYEVIEQGSKGLFGLGKKSAKVKISYNEAEYIKRKAKLMLNELLEKAGFTDAHVSVEQTDNRIILNIETETPELLIGKSAQTLDALQYVFDKMINLPEDSEISLIVDVGFYRKRRVEENVAKALAMAEKVKRSGRPFKLAPMSSILRKEIHIALKNVPGVSTISTGEGPLKQVSIVSDKPRNNRGRFNNRRNNRYNHREEN
ncbi:MAG: RNA-binding cell elongation regulator Jag/EloR [Candidatus Mucispirillum faecigallinarum]|uniref:Jag N-terminal domain-containing protein n=1 Tax=Candidatus Mucispirillum faecigallinarum TaxID=2838699 RepID=A0A9D2GTI9_9BACT|nr:RNA-binding cell elongation regulator Jag/EloR [Candidatus Mucispirillum faecigallinarum]HIZ89742.1 Jag N-terminal domain-containing protein [Candidatus Mucispirillum faecigallinarum]